MSNLLGRREKLAAFSIHLRNFQNKTLKKRALLSKIPRRISTRSSEIAIKNLSRDFKFARRVYLDFSNKPFRAHDLHVCGKSFFTTRESFRFSTRQITFNYIDRSSDSDELISNFHRKNKCGSEKTLPQVK